MKAPPLLLASLFASAAIAADYKPVSCDTAQPYAGAPLLSPAGRLDLRVPGDLDGDLDEATAARLREAFEHAMSASQARSLTATAHLLMRALRAP